MSYNLPYAEAIAAMNRYSVERRPFLFVLDYEQHEGYVVPDPLQASTADLLFDFHGLTNVRDCSPSETIKWSIAPESLERYRERFGIIAHGFETGDTRLANLTVRTPMQIDATLTDIYHSTRAKYRMCIPGRWVCFSPETFVTVDAAHHISSEPMKGTINSSIPDAERVILNDYKETREHVMMVELMVEELRAVATEVSCEDFRFITRIQRPAGELLQVSSRIGGSLRPPYDKQVGSLFDALLPAASICGTPKQSTMRLIAAAEGEPRGYYTGVMGYYDGTTIDSSVLIRFIEWTEERGFAYRSGGGVTADSTAEKEYNEVIEKVYLPTGQC